MRLFQKSAEVESRQSEHADWVQRLLGEYEGRLIRYALRFTGNLEAARDVAQETFLRLCSTERRKIECREAAWLFAVCRSRAIDLLRKENRMSPLDEVQMASWESTEPTAAETLLESERTGKVLKALATLPPREQEVVRLKFQEGLSYKEISAVTQLSVSNVGLLIHQGVKSLREQLKSYVS